MTRYREEDEGGKVNVPGGLRTWCERELNQTKPNNYYAEKVRCSPRDGQGHGGSEVGTVRGFPE